MTTTVRVLLPITLALFAALAACGAAHTDSAVTDDRDQDSATSRPAAAADHEGDPAKPADSASDWDLETWSKDRVAEAVAGLNPTARNVTQDAGTERPFTHEYNKNKADGTYVCVVCELPLYSSKAKFDSGTGWPSFYETFDAAHVATDVDYDIGYARTELHCVRCSAHLGHRFPDGPEPTGQRHCINGVSLRFVPAGEPLPR